jgi:hypothetical protein
MRPDRVAILKCGGRLSAIRNEADKNRLDRKQVRCLQWQWLFGGQATRATRPQDLPAAMSEVPGLRKNQKSRPLRRLADSAMGQPGTMCWLHRSTRASDSKTSHRALASPPTEAALFVERNPDTLFVAPNDTAALGAAIRCHHQYKGVWKPQRTVNFQGGPGRGEVANNTIDFAAAELDGSGLEYPMTRRNSMFPHGNTVLKSARLREPYKSKSKRGRFVIFRMEKGRWRRGLVPAE